jgi:hypothetical protein
MQISQYNEKSFVVRILNNLPGFSEKNDKKLIEFGGKYNNFLKGGSGWIFPNFKRPLLDNYIDTLDSDSIGVDIKDTGPRGVDRQERKIKEPLDTLKLKKELGDSIGHCDCISKIYFLANKIEMLEEKINKMTSSTATIITPPAVSMVTSSADVIGRKQTNIVYDFEYSDDDDFDSKQISDSKPIRLLKKHI